MNTWAPAARQPNLYLRCRAAFERRFGDVGQIEFVNLDEQRLIRVLNPETHEWVDYDTTRSRIRAVNESTAIHNVA